jgi:hypothetical protein
MPTCELVQFLNNLIAGDLMPTYELVQFLYNLSGSDAHLWTDTTFARQPVCSRSDSPLETGLFKKGTDIALFGKTIANAMYLGQWPDIFAKLILQKFSSNIKMVTQVRGTLFLPVWRIGWIRNFATKNYLRILRNGHIILRNFVDEYRTRLKRCK